MADSSRKNDISDYALIGDMRTSALVGRDGSIDYMCWPNFDSPSIFARILDTSEGGGGHWSIVPEKASVCKQNYRASSNIVQTKWINEEGVVDLTDFFALSRYNRTIRDESHGSILVRKIDCVRGNVKIVVELRPRPDYARGQSSFNAGPVEPVEHIEPATSEPGLFVQDMKLLGKDGEEGPNTPHFAAGFMTNNANSSTPEMFTSIKSDTCRATFHLQENQQVYMIMCHPNFRPKLDAELVRDLEAQTYKFWTKWVRACTYHGRFQQEVERSMLILKLLTYQPTGAIVAAPTFSLPEAIGGGRNWDYRYSWVRDASFTVYVFLKMGFPDEAEAYINFIFQRIAEWKADVVKSGKPKHLPLMFGIHGQTDLPELELDHLGGYKDSKPVRIGNAATFHVQLDIYGELMDAIYLYNKFGKPVSYQQWLDVRFIAEFVCTVWKDKDMSIWEVRGLKQNFTYSKMLLWVAIDRAIRLSEKRNFPCPKRLEWMQVRDTVYEEVMEKGFNPEMGCFIQSYEANNVLDSAVLIAPLVFFISPNDPQFISTLEAILKTPENGGLTSAGFVFRYDFSKVDDGVGGKEGTFVMCTLWLIEALIRAGKYNKAYLEKAVGMFEMVTNFRNHVGMLSEEIAVSGEQLGNTPQAFSHLAYVSAAINLERVAGGVRM